MMRDQQRPIVPVPTAVRLFGFSRAVHPVAPRPSGSEGSQRRVSVVDADCSLRTTLHGVFHLRTHALRRILVEDVKKSIITYFEYFRRCGAAQCIGFTQVEIHRNLHNTIMDGRKRPKRD